MDDFTWWWMDLFVAFHHCYYWKNWLPFPISWGFWQILTQQRDKVQITSYDKQLERKQYIYMLHHIQWKSLKLKVYTLPLSIGDMDKTKQRMSLFIQERFYPQQKSKSVKISKTDCLFFEFPRILFPIQGLVVSLF